MGVLVAWRLDILGLVSGTQEETRLGGTSEAGLSVGVRQALGERWLLFLGSPFPISKEQSGLHEWPAGCLAWAWAGLGRRPLLSADFSVLLGSARCSHMFVATCPPPAFYQRERRREGERARGREGGGESPACFVLRAVGGQQRSITRFVFTVLVAQFS